MIPMLGMIATFTPDITSTTPITGHKEQYVSPVNGVVVYVHYSHRYFTAEYKSGKTRLRESFRFSQIGKEVKLSGRSKVDQNSHGRL